MTKSRAISAAMIATVIFLCLEGCSSPRSTPIVPTTRAAASATQCSPDFSLTLSQSSATITQGQTVPLGFQMTSICGLAGTINVGFRITPTPSEVCTGHGSKQTCTTNGPTSQQCCYDFPLRAGSSTGNRITFGATASTIKTTYTITVRAQDISGGCCYGLTHTATFTLTVT